MTYPVRSIIRHYGICILCKKGCKVKYASFEQCYEFEWLESIESAISNL